MDTALFDQYVAALDRIKKEHPCTIHNIYDDIHAIQTMCNNSQTRLFTTDTCLLLFVFLHDLFYEGFFFAKDAESLTSGLRTFLQEYREEHPIRFMVVGKEADKNVACDALAAADCPLYRQLARQLFLQQFVKKSKKSKKDLKILEYLAELYDANIVEFALPEDAQEIYTMLCDEFDIYGDNIPSIDRIKKNAEKQQIMIIRRDDKIVYVHYFEIKNKISYCYYDLAHKDYRKEQLYFNVYVFAANHYEENVDIVRQYGWRDVKKVRLLKKAPLLDVKKDKGLFINFHLYEPKIEN